jgi:hypothetical protein
MSETNATAALTRREAWDLIYTLVRGADLELERIQCHASSQSITVQLADDDHEGVARLMSLLRMPAPATLLDRETGKPYRWFAGEPREFTAFGLYHPGYEPNSIVMPGWVVGVHAQMVTANHEVVL